MTNPSFSFSSDEQIRKLFREELQTFFSENKLNQSTESQQPKIVDLDGLLNARPMVGSRSTVYKKACRGIIPHSKNGKRLVFDLHVIDQWLLSNKVKTAANIAEETEKYLNNRYKKRRR